MGGQDHIVEAHATPYRLVMRRPWATAKGERRERSGWRINLHTADGRVGAGECAPLPEAGTESEPVAARTLDAALAKSRGMACDSLLTRLDDWRAAPALRCALETALLDLAAQRAGLPLACYLNPDAAARIAVNAVIGSLDEGIAGRASAAVGAGFQVLKIKLGVYPPAREVESLNALAGALPPGVLLRLDANRAWDEATATAFVDRVRDLPVDSLEEPLRDPDSAVLARLQARVPWPLALDESLAAWCRGANPLFFERGSQEPLEALPLPPGEGIKEANSVSLCGSPHPNLLPEGRRDKIDSLLCAVRRLVLKPTALGGLLPAMALAREAKSVGVESVVTSALESAPGLWAAVHLAAAIDSGLAHGLATADLLQGDMMRGAPRPQNGAIVLPGLPGLGWEG